MNIPSLPTDNLYKFMALSGLLVLILSAYYPLHLHREWENQNIDLQKELSISHQQVKVLDDSINQVTSQIKAFDPNFGITQGDKVKSFEQAKILVLRGEKKYNSLKKLILTYEILERKKEKIIITNNAKINKQNLLIESLNEFDPFQLVLIVIGVVLTMTGFFLWYHRSQKINDEILNAQHSEVCVNNTCQSCGLNMMNDDEYYKLTFEQKKATLYCSNCFLNGNFTEPKLSLKKMEERVNKQHKKSGLTKYQRNRHVKSIKYLKRWKRKFEW